MKRLTVLSAIIALFITLAPAPGRAADINWGDITSTNIVLFYPGAASWEFLTSEDHRLGGRDIKRVRKECKHCHLSNSGELDLKADEIAAGTIKMKRSHNDFEPEPIAGKKGTLVADIKAAYDKDYLYIRVEWESKGNGWKQAKGADSVPDRVSAQLSSGDKYFAKYGCFITCHNDLNTMPGSPSKKEVAADPYYGKLGRDDVRLYAFYTRNGSWSAHKSSAELAALLKEHGRIDLRSVALEAGAGDVSDGWVFDDRRWENKDIAPATASWNGKNYAVVFKVKLGTADDYDVKVSGGGVVSAGFAIHEDGASKRKHYVSFPYSIGVGAAGANITAVKLND